MKTISKLFPVLLTCSLLNATPVFSVDIDADGSPAEEEALAGTSDLNPDERPFWWKTFYGASENSAFGGSVSQAGDVNNDGYDDIIVGNDTVNLPGVVRVYSGIDGSVLHELIGVDRFGRSVDGVGDVNNDGYGDFVVSEPNTSSAGYGWVYSGIDGSLLHQISGSVFFGTTADGVGDINGDGYGDILLSRPDDHVAYIRIYSGYTGEQVGALWNSQVADFTAAQGAGDVNNDGYADVIIGIPHRADSWNGRVRVYDQKNNQVLLEVTGDAQHDFFGVAVDGAGDVNNDGYDDVIVGAPYNDNNGWSAGQAKVFSGQDGSILYTWHGEHNLDFFGYTVSRAGDVNGDGYADLLVGAPRSDVDGQEDAGTVYLFSGIDGSELYRISGHVYNYRFGSAISEAGDVDGDGYDDIVIGVSRDSEYFPSGGSARLILGKDMLQDLDADFLLDSADDDRDNDGMLDSWEENWGFNKLDSADAYLDGDGDRLANRYEYLLGKNPTLADLNGRYLPRATFDLDMDDDLLFQLASGDDNVFHIWEIENNGLQSVKVGGSVDGVYDLRVVADIDADLDQDLIFQSEEGFVLIYNVELGRLEQYHALDMRGTPILVGSGDFDGDLDADLVFEENGSLTVWLIEDGGLQTEVLLGSWAGHSVAAVADIDADGDDDLITGDASGNVNVIEMQNGSKQAARWVGVWPGRGIVGAGDADQDGDADIFMASDNGTGADVMVVEMENGLKVAGRWLGVWADTVVKALGDIDQDGDVDLIQQNTATGSVQVVEIEGAAKVIGRWLGNFTYDVKGVIDADADGDIDVVLHDGSNVALIELENGAKSGGAKWLGINTGEMRLLH